ncbi:MAG: FlgO family outer membrane protein [Elusimicrobia bacterium]|nr:FlgO family outer membrane protein [Elusimicrobiota bacterium]
MRKLWLAAAVLAALSAPAQAWASDPLKRLAGRLAKNLKEDPPRKVAVLSFPYPDGSASAGSTVVQERLTTYLAEDGDVQVVERQLLKKILEERKLQMTGLLDAKTSQEIGKVLGVNVLVTGTLNDVREGRTEVNARAIDADSGRILSAGQATVERTWDSTRPTRVVTDPRPAATGKSLAQIAILLDTSNSMDGLIQQTKTQLWRIVNELAASRKNGEAPAIQVALYQYGNNSLSLRESWIQQVVPFTADLDQVSQRLFALYTNGGDEFTGAVLSDASRRLDWSPDPSVYKAIFIAGNEPFTQGPIPFRESIADAARKGIVVNTIYCGNRDQGIREQWLAGAQAGGGDYLVIDQDSNLAMVTAPQDPEIDRLSNELNQTFVPMGRLGAAKAKAMLQQDSAVAALRGGAAGERAAFKAAPQYAAAASGWDAVSMVMAAPAAAPAAISRAELPAEMKQMDDKQLKADLEGRAAKRKDIQTRLQKLQGERDQYVNAHRGQAGMSMGEAVVKSVRKQAAKKGYSFKS